MIHEIIFQFCITTGKDQEEIHVLGSIRVDASTSRQHFHDQNQPSQNENSFLEEETEQAHDLDNYSVVDQMTRCKSSHLSTGMPVTQPLATEDQRRRLTRSNSISSADPSLQNQNHVYANVEQANPERKSCQQALTPKKPREHTDETDGTPNMQCLYDVVDKNRERKRKAEVIR